MIKHRKINSSIGCCYESHDSSVGIATGYGLVDRDSGVLFPSGAGNLSLLHSVQTGSGFHPASYPEDTGGFFPGLKRPGMKLTAHLHLVPRSRKRGAVPPLAQYVFMAWCLIKHRDKLPSPSPFIRCCYSVQKLLPCLLLSEKSKRVLILPVVLYAIKTGLLFSENKVLSVLFGRRVLGAVGSFRILQEEGISDLCRLPVVLIRVK
jgi:hypothetical protein